MEKESKVLWGIVLLLIILLLIIRIFILNNSLEIKIYKEVCEEGFFNKDFYNACIFLLMDYEDLMNMTRHNEFSRMCNIWAIKIGEIKTSCEKFEVDKIFNSYCKYENDVVGNWKIGVNNTNKTICPHHAYFNKSVLKEMEVLEFEFLNDNCECIQICFDNENKKPSECYLNKKYKGACHKYKCGGYEIIIK